MSDDKLSVVSKVFIVLLLIWAFLHWAFAIVVDFGGALGWISAADVTRYDPQGERIEFAAYAVLALLFWTKKKEW